MKLYLIKKPRIRLIKERGCYECRDSVWIGWGWTPLDAYNDWATWAIYGGTCA